MMPAYKPVPPIEQVTWLDHYSVNGKDSFTLKELAERTKADCVKEQPPRATEGEDDTAARHWGPPLLRRGRLRDCESCQRC